MAESMKRLDPGHYTITLGGVQYWVTMEKKRVETGKSKKGTEKAVWKASRGDFVLTESERYRDAKRAVFDDAALPEDQRPQAPEVDQTSQVSDPPVSDEPGPIAVTPPDDDEDVEPISVAGPVEPPVVVEDQDADTGQYVPVDQPVEPAQPQTVADSDNFEQHLSEPSVPEDDDNAPHFSWA